MSGSHILNSVSYSLLYGTQIKKEYAYNQSYASTSTVLPDMGQTEKERGESHEWEPCSEFSILLSTIGNAK